MSAVPKSQELFEPPPSVVSQLGAAVIPKVVAGIIDKANGALSPESRKEFIKLASELRRMADLIDSITAPRVKRAVDELGEPTFSFAARVPIPDNFRVTTKLMKYALERGFDLVAQSKIREDFISYYRKTGKKWQDWGATWMTWVRNEQKRRAAAPKTRATTAGMARW